MHMYRMGLLLQSHAGSGSLGSGPPVGGTQSSHVASTASSEAHLLAAAAKEEEEEEEELKASCEGLL